MMRNFIKMFLSALRALEFLHGLGRKRRCRRVSARSVPPNKRTWAYAIGRSVECQCGSRRYLDVGFGRAPNLVKQTAVEHLNIHAMIV